MDSFHSASDLIKIRGRGVIGWLEPQAYVADVNIGRFIFIPERLSHRSKISKASR